MLRNLLLGAVQVDEIEGDFLPIAAALRAQIPNTVWLRLIPRNHLVFADDLIAAILQIEAHRRRGRRDGQQKKYQQAPLHGVYFSRGRPLTVAAVEVGTMVTLWDFLPMD